MIEDEIYLTAQDFDILNTVDAIVYRSLIAGDLRIAMDFGRSLRRNQQIQGLALAKLLYEIEQRWTEFTAGKVDGSFVDMIASELGIAPYTTHKYSHLWKVLFESGLVPQEYVRVLMCKPIKGLLLLPSAVEDQTLNWEEVAQATTVSEMRQAVRNAHGVKTSGKHGLVFMIDARTGILWVRQGEEQKIMIGSLYINAEDELTRTAVARIIRDTGIMEI